MRQVTINETILKCLDVSVCCFKENSLNVAVRQHASAYSLSKLSDTYNEPSKFEKAISEACAKYDTHVREYKEFIEKR